jgi:molybdopterin-containing oxidoreductase family membrane subunit
LDSATLKKYLWIAGVTLFAAGLYGWIDRFAFGHVHAHYGNLIPWGLWVAVYIYFIGLSAGSFLISSLVYVFNIERFERIGRLAVFTAVVTLFLALLSIWADLGHQFRAWHVLAYPNFKSPMAWMIWLYSTYFALLIVELWFLLRSDLVRGSGGRDLKSKVYGLLSLGSNDLAESAISRDRRVVRILATIGVPVAILFHGGVGALFGVVAARPLWHSGMFPILFLLSALASGGALLTVIAAVFQDGWTKNSDTVVALGQMVFGLLLLDLLFQFSEMLVGLYGGIPGHVAGLKLILGGPYWWVFWGWQILLGTVIPVILLAAPSTRRDPRYVSLSGLLIALGFIAVRLNIVIPGLAVEELRGISGTIFSMRMSAQYFPSLTEWMLTCGIVGLGLILFGVGEYFLPLEKSGGEHVRVR